MGGGGRGYVNIIIEFHLGWDDFSFLLNLDINFIQITYNH